MNVRSATVGRRSLSVPTTWLEKTRVVRLKVGAYSTPFPASVREMAPPSDLLVPVRVPVHVPVVEGVNVTPIGQLAPAWRIVPKLVCGTT